MNALGNDIIRSRNVKPKQSCKKDHTSNFIIAENTSRFTTTNSEQKITVSLRYLDEFIGKLRCASELLEMNIYPDAKEVTETLGLYNALRKLMASITLENTTHEDKIIVVGDGRTPRTASLCAYLMNQWTCYSIDPVMSMSTSSKRMPWDKLNNLITMRKKIQDVHIKCRKAIILLAHAHVSIQETISSIEAENIITIITLPCCNFYGKQEYYQNRLPDIVYDDPSILSEHREIRLWVDPTYNVVPVNVFTRQDSQKGKKKILLKEYHEPKENINKEKSLIQEACQYLKQIITQRNDKKSVVYYNVQQCIESHVSKQSHVLILGDDNESTFGNALKEAGYAFIYYMRISNEGSIQMFSYTQDKTISLQINENGILENLNDEPVNLFDQVIDLEALDLCLRKVEASKRSRVVRYLCYNVDILTKSTVDKNVFLSFCRKRRQIVKAFKFSNEDMVLTWCVKRYRISKAEEEIRFLLVCCRE